jgi:hypothetical protein
MADEGITEEERLKNEREYVRSNPEKLLEVLEEFFPTWKWQKLSAGENVDLECETRVHFVHDSPLHSEFSGDSLIDEKLLTNMLYHSVLFYMSISSEQLKIANACPRQYYNLEGVERLLVVYRAWARSNSSDSEYERVNSLVASCFE